MTHLVQPSPAPSDNKISNIDIKLLFFPKVLFDPMIQTNFHFWLPIMIDPKQLAGTYCNLSRVVLKLQLILKLVRKINPKLVAQKQNKLNLFTVMQLSNRLECAVLNIHKLNAVVLIFSNVTQTPCRNQNNKSLETVKLLT